MIRFIRYYILRHFFKIELTSMEKEIADEAVDMKYAVALGRGLFASSLVIPAILFLDTNIIVSVLIPITMVAGTAWFAISLADMKKKFESFGLEITRDLFESFTTSLLVLIWLSIFSLFMPLWKPAIDVWLLSGGPWVIAVSAGLGAAVMIRIVYLIFSGALKYDINDSMLSGQSEAAEKFYKRALSVLYVCADNLQQHKSLQVANYYIGVSFWEIFSYIQNLTLKHLKSVDKDIEDANKLIMNPSMAQEDADKISMDLIGRFLEYCEGNISGADSTKSYQAVQDEMGCLRDNTDEDQDMVDTRLSVIFQEIGHLMENQGETLFKAKSKK